MGRDCGEGLRYGLGSYLRENSNGECYMQYNFALRTKCGNPV